MASSRTHTLTAAARFSDSSKSRFHSFLNNNADKAVYTLRELSKKQARQFSKINKGLSTGKLPWNIAILALQRNIIEFDGVFNSFSSM